MVWWHGDDGDGREVVKLIVGGEDGSTPVEMLLPKRLFDQEAPALACAFKHDCREKATGVIHLPQFEPADLDRFLEIATLLEMQISTTTTCKTTEEDIVKCMPIASYCSSAKTMQFLSDACCRSPTIDTVLVVEKYMTDAKWSEATITKLHAKYWQRLSNKGRVMSCTPQAHPYFKEKLVCLRSETLAQLLLLPPVN